MNSPEQGKQLQRSIALLELGRFEEALIILRSVLASNPEDPDVICTLGWLQLELGDLEEAQSLAYRAAELAPDSTTTHNLLTSLAIARNNYKQAQTHLDAWLSLAPEDYGALDLQCRLHLLRNHRIKALRLAEQIRDKFANEPEAHLLHARTCQALIRIKQARISAERALRLAPEHPEAILITGYTWSMKGKTELAAIELLANGCALYPDNQELRKELDSAITMYVGSATISTIVAILIPPYLLVLLWDLCCGRRLRLARLTPTVKQLVSQRLRVKNALVIRKSGIVLGVAMLGIQINRTLTLGPEILLNAWTSGLCAAAILILGISMHGFRRARQRAGVATP